MHWVDLTEEEESQQEMTFWKDSCAELDTELHLNQGGFHLLTWLCSAGNFMLNKTTVAR